MKKEADMTNINTKIKNDTIDNKLPVDKTLNLVLSEIQDSNLPAALPIAHLTSVSSFQEIQDANFTLKPQTCKVFERDLLYFSYGGIFHRYGCKPIKQGEATYLPVAFLFRPELIKKMTCFYPYDTGAACKNKYGDDYSKEMQNWDKYKVDNDGNFKLPSKIVYCFYENNKNYDRHKSVQRFNKEHELIMEPMDQLLNFLNKPLAEADYRKNVIECQTSLEILLNDKTYEYIMWIGCPEQNFEQVLDMCDKIKESLQSGHYPSIKPYNSESGYTPQELIYAHLQIPAREYMDTYFSR